MAAPGAVASLASQPHPRAAPPPRDTRPFPSKEVGVPPEAPGGAPLAGPHAPAGRELRPGPGGGVLGDGEGAWANRRPRRGLLTWHA